MPREAGSASTDGNDHYHKVIIASGMMETGTVALTYACLARWRHSCVRPCINHSLSMKGTAVYNIALFSVMYWLNVQAGNPAHLLKRPLRRRWDLYRSYSNCAPALRLPLHSGRSCFVSQIFHTSSLLCPVKIHQAIWVYIFYFHKFL